MRPLSASPMQVPPRRIGTVGTSRKGTVAASHLQHRAGRSSQPGPDYMSLAPSSRPLPPRENMLMSLIPRDWERLDYYLGALALSVCEWWWWWWWW